MYSEELRILSKTIIIILDKACYKDMIRLAEKSENTYLKGYVKLLIDTINLILSE